MRGLLAIWILAALVVAYNPGNYFFFTVLSNIMAAVLMAGQALWPGWMTSNGMLRGAVTHPLAGTGGAAIDWLLFPPERRLATISLWVWLFPAHLPHRHPDRRPIGRLVPLPLPRPA